MNKEKELLEIAKAWLNVRTFALTRVDRDDFYECHIACIKEALNEAFRLGQKSVAK